MDRDRILLYLLCAISIIVLYKLNKLEKKEHMTGTSIGSNNNLNEEALANLASLYTSSGTLTVPNLRVTGKVEGNLIVNGRLSVKNGSRFEGERHLFKDQENKDWLRVGAVHGTPGIYSHTGDLTLGAPGGSKVSVLHNDLVVGKMLHVNGGSRFHGNYHLFKDIANQDYLRVGAAGANVTGIERWGSGQGGKIQIGPWTAGTKSWPRTAHNQGHGHWYDQHDYLKSKNVSNSILTSDNASLLSQVRHANGNVYNRYVANGKLWPHSEHAHNVPHNWGG